jgi:WD40 repeat protein
VYQTAFAPDGASVISVSADRTIRFWDAVHGRQLMILNGHKDQVFALALSPDGNRIATGGKDRSVRVWNISPEGSRELITFDIGTSVRDIAISPDGRQLIEGGTDNTARVLNATSGQVMFTLTGHTDAIEGVAYSSDGKKLLTCGRDGTAKIWDSTSGKQLANFSEHKGAIWDCALSADGKKAATGGQDQTVKVWDPATGKLLQNLAYQGDAALAVSFSPDSQLLAAGYADHNIVLWDANTGKQLSILIGHTDRVQALAFRPDGQVLASGAEDGNIILWDMNPERWGQYQPAMRDRGDAILDLAFSSDGKFLFSGGTDGIGTLWDLENRHADFHTYGHADRIYATEISPDGNFLYSSSRDGTIRVYVFSLQELLKLAEKRTSRQFTEEECRQYLNAACPAEAVGAVPPAPSQPPTTGGGPAAPETKIPPDKVPPATDNQMRDENSSSTAAEAQANGGDLFELGRFERPFNSGEMNIYYPDVDIVEASLSQNAAQADFKDWIVATITLAGPRGDSLQGNYGIELDLNADGRGDLLITTLTPGKDWSPSGVRIWADKNGDVGNQLVYLRDGPQENGDGYETLIFDQGSTDPRDLAWSRLSPTDPNSVQIALQRSVIHNDPQFVWTAWASRDPLKPAWFDYNDHFTFEQAGSPLKSQPQFYPLGELEGVDNTCRRTFGFEAAAGQQVFCQ